MRCLKAFFGINKDRHTAAPLIHNPATIPPNLSAAWLRSHTGTKHAIAVAAATAAAADAAVAAAQAAAAVVRLTSLGRGTLFGASATSQERWASLKIQTVFRGYLARKALRALKGVVKVQAVVRGFLVRKQASATLRGMQALIRAQATVRSHQAQAQARKSISHRIDHDNCTFPSHSRRFSASLDSNFSDDPPKVVEIDPGRPKLRSRDDPPSSSSPLPCRRISVPYHRESLSEWGLTGEECRFSTAQSTPRFAHSCGDPPTPARSVCGNALFCGYDGNFPHYMANTQSSKAKLRSYSAPKQRPEPGAKRQLSVREMMESRSSVSGVCMPHVSFKNAVMGKLDSRDRMRS